MSAVDHVLLTRFNLPSAGVEASIRSRDGWLTNRWDLFLRYCFPSVAAQANQNFHWIIYFDPESPAWLRERIDALAGRAVFTPIFRASVSNAELIADCRSVSGATGELLVTTNLDNDDGLAVDFVERIQAVPRQRERTAVFLARGLIKSGGDVYLRVDRDNAFPTVIETWDSPVTCWADWHNLLRRSMPVIDLMGSPGWLQVVHGENVSNRVHGKLTSPTAFRSLFPAGLDDVDAPGPLAIAVDRMLVGPARTVGGFARRAVKRLALGILGKNGLDRAKAVLGARR